MLQLNKNRSCTLVPMERLTMRSAFNQSNQHAPLAINPQDAPHVLMLRCIEAHAFPGTSAERDMNLQAQIFKNSKTKNKNAPSEASSSRPAAPHHHLPAGARPDASLFLFLQVFHLDNARSLDGCQNTFGKLVT